MPDISSIFQLGLDVYHIDRLLAWSETRTKYTTTFIKVAEYVVDPLFVAQWAASDGLIDRGGYDFFRPTKDPIAAARYFVQQFGEDLGERNPVLDLEVFDGVTNLLERAKIWIDEVYRLTGKWAIIYTNKDVLKSAGAGLKINGQWKYPWLLNHELWLAAPVYDYLPELERTRLITWVMSGLIIVARPDPPPPFQKVRWLQWTWRGIPELVPGYDLEPYHKLAVDIDCEWFDLPQGENMPTYKGTVVTSSLYLRDAPSPSGNSVGWLEYNDKVTANLIVGGWWQIKAILRGTVNIPVPTTVPNVYASGSYIRLEETIPDPPPAVSAPKLTFGNLVATDTNGTPYVVDTAIVGADQSIVIQFKAQ